MLDLDFKFKPSGIYVSFMLIILGASIGILFSLPVHFIFRLFGLGLMVAYCAYIQQFVFLRGSQAVLGIKHEKDTQWTLYLRDKRISAELLGDSLVTSFVTVLRFRLPDKRSVSSCVLLRDSLAPGLYKKLQVLLRCS